MSSMDSMLSVIPPLILGGGLIMLTDRFINQPYHVNRRRARRFDELEDRDLRTRGRRIYYNEYPYMGW